MPSVRAKCSLLIVGLIIGVLVLTHVIFVIHSTNDWEPYESDEKDGHDTRFRDDRINRIVDEYHHRLSKRTHFRTAAGATTSRYAPVLGALFDDSTASDGCGVGWYYRNDSLATTGCDRVFNSPSAIDYQLQDPATSPCVNFYEFACGRFNNDPRNVGKDAAFLYVHENALRGTRQITESIIESKAPDQSKLSGFYHACMAHSLTNVEDISRSPLLQKLLNTIDKGLNSYQDLSRLWGVLQTFDTILPVELTFEIDPLNATRLIPMVMQSGLFDEAERLNTNEHLGDVINRLSVLYTSAEAATWAKKIVQIELVLQQAFVATKATNLVDYLQNYRGASDILPVPTWWERFDSPRFNLTLFIEGANPGTAAKMWLDAVRSRDLWCYSAAYLDALPRILYQFDLKTWGVYTQHAILFHLDSGNSAPKYDPEIHYAYHRSYEYRYSLPWQQPRYFLMSTLDAGDNSTKEDRCLSLTEAYLPVVVNKYYIHQYLPASTIERLEGMATVIKDEYQRTLGDFRNTMQYISNDQRLLFYDKLSAVSVSTGMPTTFLFENAQWPINPESYVESVLMIRHYHVESDFRVYLKHVLDADNLNANILFDGLISVANAYYQHQLNTVILTAGLVQQPLFSPTYDEVSLYSRYGVMLAHEMTHSIDTIGVLFDSDGTYRPWLSETNYRNYLNQLKCFVDLYTTTTAYGNFHDGHKTLNENIADVTAFQIAYQAFVRTYNENQSPPPDDERRDFFVSYAQMYCEATSKSQEMAKIMRFSHSVGSLRVNNVVSQHPEFESLWGCRPPSGNTAKCTIL